MPNRKRVDLVRDEVDTVLLAKTHDGNERLTGIAPSERVVRTAEDERFDFRAGDF